MPTFDAGGRNIVFDDRGDGSAVVLMHGLCMDRSMWDHAASALQGSYRVITPDAPGHGESDPAPDGYTFEDHAGDILALCDSLGVETAVFGGQSMGGFTSLRIAAHHGPRARGLILVDTSAQEENPDLKPQYEAFLQVALAEGVSEDLAGVLFLVFFSAGFAGTTDGEAWRKKLKDMETARIHSMVRAVLDRPDVTGLLPGIRIPALVVHGEDDIAIDMARAERLAQAFGTTVVRVPGAGHASPAEQPETVTPAIKSFLDGLG